MKNQILTIIILFSIGCNDEISNHKHYSLQNSTGETLSYEEFWIKDNIIEYNIDSENFRTDSLIERNGRLFSPLFGRTFIEENDSILMIQLANGEDGEFKFLGNVNISDSDFEDYMNRMYSYKCAKVDLSDTVKVKNLMEELFFRFRRKGLYIPYQADDLIEDLE